MTVDQQSNFWPIMARMPLGPVRLRRALQLFGGPQQTWQAPANEFLAIEGIGPETVQAIAECRQHYEPESEFTALVKNGIKFTTIMGTDYPYYLQQIYNAPVVLFYQGTLPLPRQRAIAIVGTRSATAYGREIAGRLACELAASGILVVSGLARGVDTAAHEAALAAGGLTAAVLGSSLDRLYPHENRGLARRIQQKGLVLSEFPLATPPHAGNFPYRNRIITGLCQGTVIVQCKEQSGAMISAGFALEQNREVFAVPGSVDCVMSAGPHKLLTQGARLITGAQDILNEFGWEEIASPFSPPPATTPQEEKLLSLLADGPLKFDMIALKSGLDTTTLAGILLGLELKRIIRSMPGKVYRRCSFGMAIRP